MTTTIATTTAGAPLSLRTVAYPLVPWLLMAVIAVANGVFRETVLIARLGEYGGHVVSTVVLVAAILVIAYGFFAAVPVAYSTVQLAAIGVAWTLLTVGFEFLVGYAEGTPVAVTLGQYNFLAGQVWILVPLALLVSPLLFGKYLG